jgi:hypothetical protein
MLKLLRQRRCEVAGPHFSQASDNFSSSDDPKHIEAAEAIQRQQPIRPDHISLRVNRTELLIIWGVWFFRSHFLYIQLSSAILSSNSQSGFLDPAQDNGKQI